MKRSFWFRKIAGFILIAIVAVLLFGFIVMSLWNNVLAAVVAVKTISFAQALGILVLSKILFGGFHGRGGGGSRWGRGMRQKWQTMSPEERQKFRQDWRNNCRTWGKPSQAEQDTAENDFDETTRH